MTLGRRDLKKYIDIHPWGYQKQLALQVKKTPEHISNIVTGKSNPSDKLKVDFDRVSNGAIPAGGWLVKDV